MFYRAKIEIYIYIIKITFSDALFVGKGVSYFFLEQQLLLTNVSSGNVFPNFFKRSNLSGRTVRR